MAAFMKLGSKKYIFGQTVFLETYLRTQLSIQWHHLIVPSYCTSSDTKQEDRKSLSYCVNLVKQHDFESYLATLLYPEKYRKSAFAVRAFNVEIAMVRDVVSEKSIGFMRMKFWKDTLDNIYAGRPPEQPVAMELAEAVRRHKLAKNWFERILDARKQNLQTNSYDSILDVAEYSEKTASSLNYLLLESAGIRDFSAKDAASYLGRAQGLVTLLRATPYHAQRGRVYIPTELLIKHDVSQENIKRGSDSQNVKDLMYDLASEAHIYLENARSLSKKVPKEAYPILLSSVACDHYLTLLQKANFNVFDGKLNQRNPWLPLTLWYKNLTKRSY